MPSLRSPVAPRRTQTKRPPGNPGRFNRLVEAALDTARDQADLARAQAIARLRLLTPFRDFVIANEEPLRRIAAYSPSLRWILWYIDFVLRTQSKL